MFLLPLVLARWAEVQGNGCGSGTFVLDKLKDAGTNSFVPISDPFEDIPGCFRTGAECEWQGARSLLRSAEVVKQETTACISWVGGMFSISPTTYVLWLWVRGKKAQ